MMREVFFANPFFLSRKYGIISIKMCFATFMEVTGRELKRNE